MRVLEIGFGIGDCSIQMSLKFKSYYGIEPLKELYDVFIELSKTYNNKIKSFNMNLKDFVSKTNKKFDMIILRNVIHFIGYEKLIYQCSKIVKQKAYIIIQNTLAKPIRWGNTEFIQDSINFNEIKWLKFKDQLDTLYDNLLNSSYLHKYKTDDKFIFVVLKTNNYFI
jgi:cyclopropane fatty-acyl-phospholipid synthase-like methyltransferase